MTSQREGTQLTVAADPAVLAGVKPGTAAHRDWQILRWIGRMGAVSVDHLRARFALGRTVAYRRSAVLIEAGLIERVPCLPGQSRLLRATQQGLRMAGLSGRVAVASPALNAHHVACAWIAMWLERQHGQDAVLSERDVWMAEGIARQPVASSRIGELPNGEPRLHRPDLAVLNGRGVALVVEVELSPKAPERLERIVRSWRRARWVERVRYYAAHGATARGVARAIARARAAERVELVSLESVLRDRAALERPGRVDG
jgi:hypothetical protein